MFQAYSMLSFNRLPWFIIFNIHHNIYFQDYYIADASEDQVFLCVTHNKSSTHLYISDVTGTKYSLSLENVIYFNPIFNTFFCTEILLYIDS